MIVFIKTFITFILVYALILFMQYASITNMSIHLRILSIGFGVSVFLGTMYELFTY
jgi:hypothetical protein